MAISIFCLPKRRHLLFLFVSAVSVTATASLVFLFFIKNARLFNEIKKVHSYLWTFFRQKKAPAFLCHWLSRHRVSSLNYSGRPPNNSTRLSSCCCMNLLYVAVRGLSNAQYSSHVLSKSAGLPMII